MAWKAHECWLSAFWICLLGLGGVGRGVGWVSLAVLLPSAVRLVPARYRQRLPNHQT